MVGIAVYYMEVKWGKFLNFYMTEKVKIHIAFKYFGKYFPDGRAKILTSKGQHETFKFLLVLSEFDHQQPTECRVESGSAVHVRSGRLDVVDTKKRKMFALREKTIQSKKI